jgi:hypothetical protein
MHAVTSGEQGNLPVEDESRAVDAGDEDERVAGAAYRDLWVVADRRHVSAPVPYFPL